MHTNPYNNLANLICVASLNIYLSSISISYFDSETTTDLESSFRCHINHYHEHIVTFITMALFILNIVMINKHYIHYQLEFEYYRPHFFSNGEYHNY
jgi:hypothetical protein